MISDAGLSEESIMNFKIVIVEIIKQMKNKSLYFVREKYTFVNIDLKKF